MGGSAGAGGGAAAGAGAAPSLAGGVGPPVAYANPGVAPGTRASFLNPQTLATLGKAGPILSGAAGEQPDMLGRLAAMGPPPTIQPIGPPPVAPGGQVGLKLADILRPPYKAPMPLPRTRGELATNPAAGGYSGVGGELIRRY